MSKFKLRAVAFAVAFACGAPAAFATDTANIQQSGTNGVALINQMGNIGNADALIVQGAGDSNVASINQTDLAQSDLAAIAHARIDQVGNGNLALLSQGGNDQQIDSISQTGDRNSATLTTLASKSGAGIVQVGNDNGADVTFNAADSALDVNQAGNNNFAGVSVREGGFASVRVTMNGDGNAAYIDSLGIGNFVETQQTGNYNELYVTQRNTSFAAGNDNVATITQSTNYNLASITQVGSNLTGTIVQNTGDRNTAVIYQQN